MRIIHACAVTQGRNAAVTTARQLATMTSQLRLALAEGGEGLDTADAELTLTALNCAIADIDTAVAYLRRLIGLDGDTEPASGDVSLDPGTDHAASPEPAQDHSCLDAPALAPADVSQTGRQPIGQAAPAPAPQRTAVQATPVAEHAALLLRQLMHTAPATVTDVEHLMAALINAAEDLNAISQRYLMPTRQRRAAGHLTIVGAPATEVTATAGPVPSVQARPDGRPTPFILDRRRPHSTTTTGRPVAADLLVAAA
ncbi:hypothetical protein AB0B66_10465 [Catellatospora sp. NPDC049111]|uniref:hypothetical protein n=1 Tax=Catellatospora sp. NPDC049111 TaxID=3155271 RepID=UPI0034039F19